MLRFGIVSKIDLKTVQARVSFQDDGCTSFWLPILQRKTMNDKFFVLPDVGEEVACLMDENSEDGVILGAVYSSEDVPVIDSEKQMSMNLEDGSLINVDKENETLTISFKKIVLVGDIKHEGKLENTDGIKSDEDITDKKSSMQDMRDIYNAHKHTGNQGQPTSTPQGEMK